MDWKLDHKNLNLKFVWKIARAKSANKKIYQVRVRRKGNEGLGEAAFLTKDDVDLDIHHQFDKFTNELFIESLSLRDFEEKVLAFEMASPLKFAIISAYADLLVKEKGIRLEELLETPLIRKIETSFSIPIIETNEIKNYLERLDLKRFQYLKLKVCKETAVANVNELIKNYNGTIRIDGNESWDDPDEVIKFLDNVSEHRNRIQFIEQPLKHNLISEQEYLKQQRTEYKYLADESITTGDVTEIHKRCFDAVNIKLMKYGGFYKAIDQISDAKKLGLEVMLGCMVETSLSIKYALHVASNVDYFDLDGFLFFEEEPYGLLSEQRGLLSVVENNSSRSS